MEFLWESVHHDNFCKLKQLLISIPVLAFPDFVKGFILATDASVVSLGAILAKSHGVGMAHPIAYASKTLQQHVNNFAIMELNTLDIVWAIKYTYYTITFMDIIVKFTQPMKNL